MTQIDVKVYIRQGICLFKHVRTLVFSNEKQADDFITSLNADVDFVDIGNEMIRRSLITKVTKEVK